MNRRPRPAGLRRVVVTGIGLVTPLGIGRDATWAAASAGAGAGGPITSFDPSRLPTRIACEVPGFPPEDFMDKRAARRMDRFAQFAVAAARMALDDAGLDAAAERDSIGVYFGSGIGGLQTFVDQTVAMLERGPDRLSPLFIPMMIPNMGAAQVSMTLGLRGPLLATVSACATSAHAIGEAFDAIRLGRADAILAGGSETSINELGMGAFNAMRALSTRNDDPAAASRPFDANRDGFVMGEAGAVLVLEEREHAVARGADVYAELLGYGLSGDAHHLTEPDPTGEAPAAAMRMAMADAEIEPGAVAYVNAHATSTPVGDPSNPVEDLTIIPRSGVAEDASNPSRPPLPYGAPTDYASAAVNYIGINDWNDGSEIHEMLKTLAPVGDFSDPGGNGIHWDQNVMTVYGSGPRAVTYLFSGGNMHTTNSPNGTLLSPQGADRYIIDPAAFDDFVANPGTGRDMETLNLGAATDSLAPQDFEVRFEGADGGPASLATTGNGDIRFGADLSGENASIKAGGQIRIVGVGVDLSADPDAERAGVSLYARDDIFISTLRPHEDDPTLYDYVDVQLKGIVYSWKNITVEVGGEKHAGRKFDLRGAMVAYGGDPSAPPVAGQGNVYLTADSVNLTFDPAYLTSWMPSAPTSVQMTNLSTHEL